ncbi:DNA-directed RNA polymerase subunit alpha C-terminal domain-containing protein [Nonomuraea sp. NPDC050202]|uniref:DNA-directed RNA polymerase subunit alpha C-terminal domain-containing protein n=1 Tax=Nonomuraea sp. NPDC050202 TaxID=3155035 RepID=UPI0033F3BA36
MSITDTTSRTIANLVKATGLPGNTDIRLLDLKPLARNCLLREGIRTLAILAEHDDLSLTDIRIFGDKCLANVRAVLSRLGERYADIMQNAPPLYQEIADLAGALRDGYDQDLIASVLARVTEAGAPGYLLCVWAEHDVSGYGGDSEIYIDGNHGGGLCHIGGDLWAWLSQHPLTPGTPATPGDPSTWKGNRAGFDLASLPVDDGGHNFARTTR